MKLSNMKISSHISTYSAVPVVVHWPFHSLATLAT